MQLFRRSPGPAQMRSPNHPHGSGSSSTPWQFHACPARLQVRPAAGSRPFPKPRDEFQENLSLKIDVALRPASWTERASRSIESSFVRIIPPSPAVISLLDWKLKVAALPNVPIRSPRHSLA